METSLTNIKRKTPVDQSRITSENDKGIVITTRKSWQYIPKENITTSVSYDDGYYYNKENVPKLEKVIRTEAYNSSENPIETNYTEKARYRFGLKNVSFYNKKVNKVCGVISNYIYLNNYNYITLSVKETEGENAAVEYYILDGVSEIAILPEGQEKVIKEKLFYNMPTRFTVNQIYEAPILYEDGIESDRNYLELSLDDYENHEYTLTYIPGGDPYKYIPENPNIRVKVILRGYSDTNYTPIKIKGIVINKYGGDPDWN